MPARAEITGLWIGGVDASKRKTLDAISKDDLKKVFYGIKGFRPENTPALRLVVGLFIDKELHKYYTTTITKENEGKELANWFEYPPAQRTPGRHTIQFKIATADNVDDKTRKVTGWPLGESKEFPFEIGA